MVQVIISKLILVCPYTTVIHCGQHVAYSNVFQPTKKCRKWGKSHRKPPYLRDFEANHRVCPSHQRRDRLETPYASQKSRVLYNLYIGLWKVENTVSVVHPVLYVIYHDIPIPGSEQFWIARDWLFDFHPWQGMGHRKIGRLCAILCPVSACLLALLCFALFCFCSVLFCFALLACLLVCCLTCLLVCLLTDLLTVIFFPIVSELQATTYNF